jgi:hypothetical protein
MRHKVIGLFAVCGLYSSLGLFGIFLRASDSPQLPPKPPMDAPPAPAPAFVPQQAVGQFGQPLPEQFGQFGAQPGKFGGEFGGIGSQIDQFGRKLIAIEDGPTQLLATTRAGTMPPTKDGFDNPAVEPGKVKWHRDFDTACKAAEKSGKPVFLFQMMGKLDDQFC